MKILNAIIGLVMASATLIGAITYLVIRDETLAGIAVILATLVSAVVLVITGHWAIRIGVIVFGLLQLGGITSASRFELVNAHHWIVSYER
jgi:hypothetical protein